MGGRTKPPYRWLAIVIPVNVFAVGAGMGVPVFSILAAVPLGLWSAWRHRGAGALDGLAATLREGAIVAMSTLALMLGLWGMQLGKIAEPGFDAAEWGIPLVLYTSTASFWGWMTLMIVISPVLQFVVWAVSAELATLRWYRAAR